jgi:hypothetical protein
MPFRHASDSRHHDSEKLLKELKELHEAFFDSARNRSAGRARHLPGFGARADRRLRRFWMET